MELPIFAAWRAEIEADLDAAKAALADANAELATATESARTAKIERRALADAIDRLGARQPLSSGLALRRRHRDDELNAAEGRLTRARNVVRNAHLQIEDLQQAIDQLNEIAPRPEPEPVELEAAA
jgi:chromosome segregation ATPase